MEFARFDVLYILIGVFVLLFLVQWLKRNRYLAHSLVSSSILAAMKPVSYTHLTLPTKA